MKKVLGIFCHPDDEILAGWPIFQDAKNYERHLMICCDDSCRNRPNRKVALQKVCGQENINLIYCLSEHNDFYTLPTRRADYLLTNAVENINAWLGKAIDNIKPDYIITHNPVGEYGHGSHRLLFEIVSQHPKVKNLIITDICQKSNHRSLKYIPLTVREAYYRIVLTISPRAVQTLDIKFYQRCKAVYDKYNAWTWNKDIISVCNLYLLKEKNG